MWDGSLLWGRQFARSLILGVETVFAGDGAPLCSAVIPWCFVLLLVACRCRFRTVGFSRLEAARVFAMGQSMFASSVVDLYLALLSGASQAGRLAVNGRRFGPIGFLASCGREFVPRVWDVSLQGGGWGVGLWVGGWQREVAKLFCLAAYFLNFRHGRCLLVRICVFGYCVPSCL